MCSVTYPQLHFSLVNGDGWIFPAINVDVDADNCTFPQVDINNCIFWKVWHVLILRIFFTCLIRLTLLIPFLRFAPSFIFVTDSPYETYGNPVAFIHKKMWLQQPTVYAADVNGLCCRRPKLLNFSSCPRFILIRD